MRIAPAAAASCGSQAQANRTRSHIRGDQCGAGSTIHHCRCVTSGPPRRHPSLLPPRMPPQLPPSLRSLMPRPLSTGNTALGTLTPSPVATPRAAAAATAPNTLARAGTSAHVTNTPPNVPAAVIHGDVVLPRHGPQLLRPIAAKSTERLLWPASSCHATPDRGATCSLTHHTTTRHAAAIACLHHVTPTRHARWLRWLACTGHHHHPSVRVPLCQHQGQATAVKAGHLAQAPEQRHQTSCRFHIVIVPNGAHR